MLNENVLGEKDELERWFDHLGKAGLRRLGINDEDKGNLTFDSPIPVRHRKNIPFHFPIKFKTHVGVT